MKKTLFLILLTVMVQLVVAQTNLPVVSTVPSPTVLITNALPNYNPAIKLNYVRSFVPKGPFLTPEAWTGLEGTVVDQVTDYVDGLGRPLQKVTRVSGAASGYYDIVQPVVYDEFGRETFNYLPFVSNSTTGEFKLNAATELNTYLSARYPGEQTFYGKTDFEASPLNRVMKTAAPGNSWTGSDRGVSTTYLINEASDNVVMWGVDAVGNITGGQSGPGGLAEFYSPGQLYKTRVTDENNATIIEFKDKEGRVVLKKVQYKQAPGWLETYYIYDDLGLLRWVLSPKAVKEARILSGNSEGFQFDAIILEQLCFKYVYDERNRMIEKQVPGAKPSYMVYDQRDRLVFTQDANLKANGQWMAMLYDGLNRPTITALASIAMTRAQLQAYVDGLSSGESTVNVSSSGSGSSLAANLQIDNRETGRTEYKAKVSIEFLPGFTSEPGADFVAEIVSSENEDFNDNVTVFNNPIPSGSNLNILTITYYDNYNWTSKTYDDSYRNKVEAGSNSYAETLPIASLQAQVNVHSMVTGTRVKVGDENGFSVDGKWLTTVNFYDEDGRAIQVQSENHKGGTEISTVMYNFSGAVLSTYRYHKNPGLANTVVTIRTENVFDVWNRLVRVEKVINDELSKKFVVLENEYFPNGELKKKKLGKERNINGSFSQNALEDLNYSHNIRGWLKGVNADVVEQETQMQNWFSMALNYDYGFQQNQFNGNISGMKWRTRGDDRARTFGFGYDIANRLLFADFNQRDGSNWNRSAGIDFRSLMGNGNDADQAYDENGNIKRMQQWGLKGVQSTQIDDLSYQYKDGQRSNRLQNVIDVFNDVNTKLGDFRTSTKGMAGSTTKPVTAVDYEYDENGNLVQDKNKDILSIGVGNNGIQYNHLNLPIRIKVTESAGSSLKGEIIYIYDATGRKLSKKVIEAASAANQNQAKNTETDYLGEFTYDNDALSFFAHEEGRTRQITNASTQQKEWVSDFFVKDHLGNVRMVLTDELKTDIYPIATMESSRASVEETVYSNMNTRHDLPAGYPTDNFYTPNQKVAEVNGSGNKIGPGVLLKVMSGDKFNISVSSWYKIVGGGQQTPANPLNDLLAALANSVVPMAGGKVVPSDFQPLGLLSNNLGEFLNNRSFNASKPRAGVHWVLLDEQFKVVSDASSHEQVPDESVYQNGSANPQVYRHNISGREVTRNGYLYIYVANETENLSVYFDNLNVTHVRGPLIEETHYYPFGLTMAGISSKTFNTDISNKRKFVGQELDEDFDLDIYHFKFRSHDCQIGRFLQIDPLSDKYVSNSTYAYAENRPIDGIDLEGLEFLRTVVNSILDPYSAGIHWSIYWSFKKYEYGESVDAMGRLSSGTSAKPTSPGPAPIRRMQAGVNVLNDIDKAIQPGLDILDVSATLMSFVPIGEAGMPLTALISGNKGVLTKNVFEGLVSIKEIGTQGESLTRKILNTVYKDAQVLEQVKIQMDGAYIIADFVVVKDGKVIVVAESKVNSSALSNGQKLFFKDKEVGVLTGANAGKDLQGVTVDPSKIQNEIYRWDTKTASFVREL
jgi:RHS repeat-associated protein